MGADRDFVTQPVTEVVAVIQKGGPDPQNVVVWKLATLRAGAVFDLRTKAFVDLWFLPKIKRLAEILHPQFSMLRVDAKPGCQPLDGPPAPNHQDRFRASVKFSRLLMCIVHCQRNK